MGVIEIDQTLETQQANKDQQKVWIIALGNGSKFLDRFSEEGIIAIGWDFLGDLGNYSSNEEIKKRMIEIEDSSNPYCAP